MSNTCPDCGGACVADYYDADSPTGDVRALCETCSGTGEVCEDCGGPMTDARYTDVCDSCARRMDEDEAEYWADHARDADRDRNLLDALEAAE